MKNWIAKNILDKEEIEFVFLLGGRGKSMSLSSIKMLSKVDKKTALNLFNNGSLSNALVTKGGERGVFRGLLASFGSNPAPDRICLELQKPGQISEQLISHLKEVTIIISTLNDEDKQNKSSVKKYLESYIPLLKKESKKVKVVANGDIPELLEALKEYDLKKLVTFGIVSPDVDIRAVNIDFLLADAQSIDKRLKGVTCKVQHFGSIIPLQIVGGIGVAHIYAKLSALGLAHLLGGSAVELLGYLRQEPILPGRMALVPGIKKSLLIDDSYEMTFESSLLALKDVSAIAKDEGQKRIAVFGSMAHEGRYTDQHHCLIGQKVAELKYDMLVAVGEKGHDILRCAEESGMQPNQLYHFDSKEEAGKFVQHELRMGDIILVKGNKEEKFETIVKELMAFPLQSKDDLIQR